MIASTDLLAIFQQKESFSIAERKIIVKGESFTNQKGNGKSLLIS